MNPPSIWDVLAAKLGRQPTNKEASDEVKRILREGADERLVEQAERGRLPHQRRRRP